MNAPASQRAEEAVLGAVLRDPSICGEVVGAMLEAEHFYFAPYRTVFDAIVELHYSGVDFDALVIAESASKTAAKQWRVDEREAVDKIVALRESPLINDASLVEHAKIVKRHFDLRRLDKLADTIKQRVNAEAEEPDQIAASASQEAMQIATDQLVLSEVLSYRELGRRWMQRTNEIISAREAGVELGAYFDIAAIDERIKGLRAREVLVCGGDPGVGKSGVWWVAAHNHARRQMTRPSERRVGTLILSLEMGEEPSSDRIAQRVGQINGDDLRTGQLSREEMMNAARAWANERDLPLYVNHASSLRLAQLRALIADEIRQHNVGVVVLDHFRMVKPDDHYTNRNDADDAVVEGLKAMSKDLNIALIVLAHTVKTIDRVDKRPRLGDLRGSGMISAYADFICFVYRPWMHATESERESGLVSRTAAEMLFEKARHVGEGSGELFMNLATMTVR